MSQQRAMQGASTCPAIVYLIRDRCYLNITSRCTLRCGFCFKSRHQWVVGGANLHLRIEPTIAEILSAVGDPHDYQEIVFCGLGEPTLRLYDMLEIAAELHHRGAARIRVDTDGLANLVYGRDVTPDFEGVVDAISISLNAQNESVYDQHCRPAFKHAYAGLIDFIDRIRDFVPAVTLTAIEGLERVDMTECEQVAEKFGVAFRRREMDSID